MLSQLASSPRVVGAKQSMRAVECGRARLVFLACDADPMVLQRLRELCLARGVETNCAFSMQSLGEAAQISVGAAVVAVLKEE